MQRDLGARALALVFFHQIRLFEDGFGEFAHALAQGCAVGARLRGGEAGERLSCRRSAIWRRRLVRVEFGTFTQYIDVPAAVDLAQGVEQSRDVVALAQIHRLCLVVKKCERGYQRQRDNGDQQVAQMSGHGVVIRSLRNRRARFGMA